MFDLKGGWNISFAGCGFLGIYHIGVASCLLEQAPYLIHRAGRIYGASAGALTASVLTSQACLEKCCEDVIEVAKEARKRNLGPLHPTFNLVKVLRSGLQRDLPEDAHTRASGKLCVSLTRVSDGENVLVSDFNSKDELIQALVCSCFIPVYCGLIPPAFRGVMLAEMCQNGYKDAFRFLKENNLLGTQCPSTDLVLMQDTPTCCCSGDKNTVVSESTKEWMLRRLSLLRKHHWWLDEQLVNNLPTPIKKVFCEACQEKHGLFSQLTGLLPVRVASYMLMPCTLPVESAYSAVQRFVEWIPEVPADARWIYQVVGSVYKHVWKGVSSNPGSGIPMRRCVSGPPALDLPPPVLEPDGRLPFSAADLQSYGWDLPTSQQQPLSSDTEQVCFFLGAQDDSYS
ncbi:patatin-like phospholipase domain containing 3 isoform X3 [Hoplias malabaricus]|uniref:patatin-like phospholipase domain containing 3 isoform X3 n=1 Tax=Hoplias malabaricus TaxID=27720 RepID=UPI003461FA2F